MIPRVIKTAILTTAVLGSVTPPIGPAEAAPERIAGDVIADPYLREQLAADRGALTNAAAMVDVELLHDDREADVRDSVAAAGGHVTGAAPHRVVQASVPRQAIAALQSADGVDYLRQPIGVNIVPAKAVRDSGPLITESVGLVNAKAWHDAGIRGAGVRIGVIDFFNQSKWNTQQLNDEVPGVSGTFCLDVGSPCSVWDPHETGHGNAVVEIIHDMAPDAAIYLGQAGTIADSYALVNWFAANGVTIVNRSLGSAYDGPGNGTGPLDELVDYAAARGITWINSAGNEGSQQYWRGSWQDPDSDGWIDFAPGDETLEIIDPTNCASILGARWSDWGPATTRTDYDFYIFAGSRQVWPEGAAANQQAGAPPIELNGIEGCESGQLNIRIRKRADGSGTAGDVIELLTYSGNLEYSQASGSAGGPIVDSSNRAVLAVGAVDPPATGTIGYYSSQGPTNDGRRKPDLSAPSCFVSSIYRAFNSCFNGTSAAAPATTGTAALLRSAGLAASPEGLAALLKHSVVDRGSAGPDNVYGTGEVRLPAPPSGGVSSSPAAFTGVTPTRIVDTRRGLGPLNRAVETEEIVDIPLAGSAVVPAAATSVAMNVTIVGAAKSGYAQVYPTMWAPVDGSSSINLDRIGQILPNFVISPIGNNRTVSVYLPSGGHLLVDVLGYFVPTTSGTVSAGRMVATAPARVLDTRQSAAGRPDLLPSGWVDHRPAAGESVAVEFRPASGIPATGVAAVVVNVTATGSPADGYVTAYPDGAPPDASTLNLTAGSTHANTAVVPLGADGRIRLFTSAGAHLIVDLIGYVTDATSPAKATGLFVPLSPARVVDSRTTQRPLVSGIAQRLRLAGSGGVPAGEAAGAVSYNATVTGTSGPDGYVQLSPTGQTGSGEFSSVNWTSSGDTIANGGLVKLGAGGQIDARSYQTTHLILDINGYWLA